MFRHITGLLVAFVSLTSFVLAQEGGPDALAELKWGASRDAATTAILLRDGVEFAHKNESGSLFTGGSWNGYAVNTSTLLFSKNRLYCVTLTFDTKGFGVDETVAQFKRISAYLTERYGKPSGELAEGDIATRVWFADHDYLDITLNIDTKGEMHVSFYDFSKRAR